MRIAYLSTLYPPNVAGGAELVLRSQAEAMSARGHDVEVIALRAEPGVNREVVNGVKVTTVGIHNEYFNFWQVAHPAHKRLLWHVRDRNNRPMAEALRELLRESHPDIVCCHNLAGWSISAWEAINSLGIPIVQVLHDQYLRCSKSNMFRNGKNCDKPCLDCRALRMSHAQASEQVTAVVGVSRFVLDRLLNAGYFSEAPIREVLYNFGTSVPSELPPKQPAPRLRLGFIGFLAESKGIEWLLRTFKGSRLSDVELLIAGRGEEQYEKGLRERYGDGDDISFLGFIKPADFFAQVDVAIVPSLWNDTLPSVVFESLGYGVPVVGSRRGGIPEMVLDGVNGLVFEPDDPASLVRAIEKLRDDPALLSSLRSGCRPSSAKFYDVQGWAAGQEEIFRRARRHADSRAVPA